MAKCVHTMTFHNFLKRNPLFETQKQMQAPRDKANIVGLLEALYVLKTSFEIMCICNWYVDNQLLNKISFQIGQPQVIVISFNQKCSLSRYHTDNDIEKESENWAKTGQENKSIHMLVACFLRCYRMISDCLFLQP